MTPPVHTAIVVGTGFAGLGAAIGLLRAGVDDVVLLEKADRVGGTWRENTYPGCACDVPSHLYSFSFAPHPGWTRTFAPGPEIQAYLERVAHDFDVVRRVRFSTEFVGATWDEAGAHWRVRTSRGDLRSRVLLLGLGPLHRPQLPAIEGLDRFGGPAFHTARWRHDVDLGGKAVAVIGTGASAIQVVPAIAPTVGRLHLFQRTPAWILPRHDATIPPRTRRLFAALPALRAAHRATIYARFEVRALAMLGDARARAIGSRAALDHLAAQVPDADLRRRLTPDHALGCKRVLLSDDFYPALGQPHVELVTDTIREVVPEGVVTADGRLRAVDALVLATGFQVVPSPTELAVVGRDGRTLGEAWQGGVEAYLGASVHGFPNLFLLLGPNTGLGHNSMIFMLEAQIAHVLQALAPVLEGRARAVEVRASAQRAHNAWLQARLPSTIWASGCRSWYLDEHGRNVTMWPDFTFRFWQRSRTLDPDAYALSEPDPLAEAP